MSGTNEIIWSKNVWKIPRLCAEVFLVRVNDLYKLSCRYVGMAWHRIVATLRRARVKHEVVPYISTASPRSSECARMSVSHWAPLKQGNLLISAAADL